MSEIVPLGTIVKPWGKVASVMLTGGERYYFLIDARGGVAMMPADVVEGRWHKASRELAAVV